MGVSSAKRHDQEGKAARGGRALLTIEDLYVAFPTSEGIATVVTGANFCVNEGRILGLVGESGSGKSVTCRAVLGLVPAPGRILSGKIWLGDRELTGMGPGAQRELRGGEIGMVFQDASAALNPVFSIGQQLLETVRLHTPGDRSERKRRAMELLELVGLPEPGKRMRTYPHELSGGMRQRVMIALALAGSPRLLIADEPTSALDVTIQDQILHLLLSIASEQGVSVLLVSHDMGVIAQTCSDVVVMYAGYVVESGPVEAVFKTPRHPYTVALLGSMPRLGTERMAIADLRAIEGSVPDPGELAGGCPFLARCPSARDECRGVSMELVAAGKSHVTACPFMAEAPEEVRRGMQ